MYELLKSFYPEKLISLGQLLKSSFYKCLFNVPGSYQTTHYVLFTGDRESESGHKQYRYEHTTVWSYAFQILAKFRGKLEKKTLLFIDTHSTCT